MHSSLKDTNSISYGKPSLALFSQLHGRVILLFFDSFTLSSRYSNAQGSGTNDASLGDKKELLCGKKKKTETRIEETHKEYAKIWKIKKN